MRTSRKIKWTLFVLMGAAAAAVVFVFIGYRYFIEDGQVVPARIPGNTAIALDQVEHTAIKNGADQWHLKAGSARLTENRKETHFDALAVEFMAKEGGNVYLWADSGVLENESNNMTVSGNVVIEKDQYQLTTQKMQYNHGKQILATHVPVTISGERFSISAESLRHDLKTKETVLKGNVEGIFNEEFSL